MNLHNPEDISAFLRIMVQTQASLQRLQREIFDGGQFAEYEEHFNMLFESLNKVITLNMELTRQYKKLMAELQ